MDQKRIGTITVAVLLIIALCAMATPASAAQDLKITDRNLQALQGWGSWIPYSYGELLEWEYGPAILDARHQGRKWIGSISATTMADYRGYYYGECVSMAKALSKSTVTTHNWQKGNKVMTSNVAPGIVIATFGGTGGGYYGHTAIFKGYIYSNGRRTGILVWDQNYLPNRRGVIARHSIKTTGTFLVTNANNYYIVRV